MENGGDKVIIASQRAFDHLDFRSDYERGLFAQFLDKNLDENWRQLLLVWRANLIDSEG